MDNNSLSHTKCDCNWDIIWGRKCIFDTKCISDQSGLFGSCVYDSSEFDYSTQKNWIKNFVQS